MWPVQNKPAFDDQQKHALDSHVVRSMNIERDSKLVSHLMDIERDLNRVSRLMNIGSLNMMFHSAKYM